MLSVEALFPLSVQFPPAHASPAACTATSAPAAPAAAMVPPAVLFALLLLLPGIMSQECGAFPEGLQGTESLNRVFSGDTAPKHALPWQALVSTVHWDRVTTGTDLVGLVVELMAYGLGLHSGFLLAIVYLLSL